MAQSVTLNGSSFSIPDVGENDWGQNVTDFLVAIPGAVLQKSGGSFTLTAEVDFGATYGLKTAYYKSQTSNPATAGQVRLARADVVSWRNQANGANLDLSVNASDVLLFNAVQIVTVAGATMTGNLAFSNQTAVRLMEQTANGTNYIGLSAPDAVTASVTLKMPDGAGTAGQVLSTDGTDTLSWINAAGGGTINSGVQGRLAVYPSNGTTIDDTVTMTNVVTVAIAAHGQTSAYTIPDSGAATANFVMSEGAQSIAGAKTFSDAAVFSSTVNLSVSNVAAFVISNASTFKVDSTNALVSIGTTTMTYPLYISKSSAGAAVTLAVENSEAANAASHARLYVVTGGASGGDPFMTFYNGVQNYSIGLDNSDSDALCVTGAATLNGTNLLRLTTAGAMTLASSLTVTTNGITVTAGGITVSAGAVTIADTTNQIVMGVTNTVTITSPAPAASRVYTIPDAGGAASFVLTVGTSTITGAKTFASSTLLLQEAGSTDVVTIAVASLAAGRTYTVIDAGGSADFVMTAGTQTIAGAITLSSSSGLAITGGDLSVSRSLSGGTVAASIINGSNTASSLATLTIQVAGATASNPVLIWTVNGVQSFSAGIANADSDRWKLSASASVGTNEIVYATSSEFSPGGAGTISSGNASLYWNDISYKTLTDRGCLPWCDDGVELVDGRRVSDLQALCQIKKHPTKKTGTGLPRLDYTSFPKHSFRRVEDQFPEWRVERDSDGEPWHVKENGEKLKAEDGVEMTMLFGVMIGAFKEVSVQITDLSQRIEALEKAA